MNATFAPDRVAIPALPTAAAAASEEAWQVLDDPAEWPAFGRELDAADGGHWESQVVVEGMHCAACAFTVEAALRQVPGVSEAQVNAASRRARVVWSPAQTLPSRWFEASAKAGYRLLPGSDRFVRELRRRESRLALWRWLVSGFCMMQVMMYAYPGYVARPGDMGADSALLLRWASWVLTLPVVLFSCGPFFRSAWRDLRLGRIGMDLPVAFGVLVTFAVSSAATFDAGGPLGHEVYFDSLTMFVFFLLTGRWLEARLRERTAGALDALMNRLPDSIDRLAADGGWTRVAVRRLAVGDLVRVRPGEAFPADGVVIEGDTSADEALLTGESRPVPRPCGDRVLAGSHNLSAPVRVRIESVGEGTRFAQIVRLMESAASRKPRLALLADRVARPFLVVVVASAAVAATLWWPTDPGRALMVAVAVLIVTCPCALSLATPAAMLASAGTLARGGVMTSNLQALEALASVDTVVFDKTGTLTGDVPRMERIYCRQGLRPGDALEVAAALAAQSLHPVAQALVNAWNAQFRSAPGWTAEQVAETAGQGIEGRMRRVRAPVDTGRHVRLGSAGFCDVAALEVDAAQVHLADEQGWLASFVLTEEPRADAAAAVAALRAEGLTVRLLSGDRVAAAREIAARCGIDFAQGGCTPEDKLDVLWRLQAEGRQIAMVGDGLNDGPSLARADASFAFGRSVPLSRAHADFVVLGDRLASIPQAIAQARRTLRVVRQNLFWAAGYNALCVPLAIAGWLPAWLAGLGMAASSLVVILNAARLSRGGEGAR
ncbi:MULTISPECIES: heavy metal translocating P-type ATPase [Variovorax]|jgi:P-type Cu2+ transporter|uniref:heavy metal translocating P-type ATPase n=1 Tax=Variovorax TaxID=34072 RepID=UPI000AF7A113|nr:MULTISPECIES: cation-translocating P-type ATPase [Variovorax]MBN8758164.1 cation-translocating P-type ATPase [Variovorax sp.]UKI07762.1 cation-translocating P-type ATPase [Variovorax paradoxus]